jgi:dynein heavy chain, axonemal
LAAGCDAQKTTFILTDTQIIDESFLEDVNNLLNTGEITNLYQKEDTDSIEEALGPVLAAKKLPQTKDTMYQEYIERLRDNFHIILCMSPIGSTLRERALKFPSMVTCCTLVWFDSWPAEALSDVAKQFMNRLDESELSMELRESLAVLLPTVHKSVEVAVE